MANDYYGILIGQAGDLIGGTVAGSGNLISGNGSVQIFIDGANGTANDNLIEGNKIGTNYAGSLAISDSAGDGTGVDIYEANGNTVGGTVAGSGNLISGHVQWGVEIQVGSSGNLVEGNEIGTNLAGTAALPNGGGVNPGTDSGGVDIDSSPNNTIGGTVAAAANVISGNANAGIEITGVAATGNVVEGDYLGIDPTSTDLIQYSGTGYTTGILIENGASTNTIGGTTAGARDFIVGYTFGIDLETATTTSNVIEGDYIGTRPNGSHGGNTYGIIINSASLTLIGGPLPSERNIISGSDTGVYSRTGETSVIEGNYIGTDPTGMIADGNLVGVTIQYGGGGSGATVGGLTPIPGTGVGNVISGNSLENIDIFDGGPPVIEGNIIGLNASGTASLGGATNAGIYDYDGNHAFTIGGTVAAARNIISGNSGDGIRLDGNPDGPDTDITIQGNYIGTDITGTLALANGGNGISVINSNANTIGGLTSTTGTGAGNLISGNAGYGVHLTGSGSTGNVVEGNIIGENASGSVPVSGDVAWYKFDGTLADYAGSNAGTLTGNTGFVQGKVGTGISLNGTVEVTTPLTVNYSTGVTFDAWFQTTALSGTIATDGGGFNFAGMSLLVSGGRLLILGGTSAGLGNFSITGPVVNDGSFHHVAVTWTGDTTVNGVKLYVDGSLFAQVTAAASILTGGQHFEMGGDDTVAAPKFTGVLDEVNVFNRPLTGAEIARIYNNGSDGQGLGNRKDGVQFDLGASTNTIGGVTSPARNVIGGNFSNGVLIYDTTSVGNAIQGDYIGTDITGDSAVADVLYFEIEDVGTSTMIGGATSDGHGNPAPGTAPGNVIDGVYGNLGLYGNLGVVSGNLLGLDATGTRRVIPGGTANNTVESSNEMIGGPSTSDRNVVDGGGFFLGNGTSVAHNSFENNYIGTDITGAVGLGITSYAFYIYNAGAANVIGAPNAGNVISDCDTYVFYVAGAPGLIVQGNVIGTNASGTAALPNGDGPYITYANGLVFGGTTAGAGNLVSGNNGWGLLVSYTTGGTIQGNRFGTDITGNYAIPNSLDGTEALILERSVSGFTVGGTTAAARNLISGNDGVGLEIFGTGTFGNLIEGNYIGVNAGGTSALPNHQEGIGLGASALDNTIGGTVAGSGNVISGNLADGITIDGTGDPDYTTLYLKADGNTNNTADSAVSAATIVGGVTYGTGITGQAFKFHNTAGERVVETNDPDNQTAVVDLTLSAWINLNSLPGATPYVIASRSYSATSENYGLYVNSSGQLVFEWYSAGSFHALTSTGAALGTRLGTFQQVAVVADGTTATLFVNGLAVGSSAMAAPLDNSAPGNLEIGGLSQGPNLFNGLIDEISIEPTAVPADTIARIYANRGVGTDLGGSGTEGTVVLGNFIGTDYTGTVAIANRNNGVQIDDAPNNTIGGNTSGPANVISGNTQDGVLITGNHSVGNVVAGNLIGTNSTGKFPVPNGTGVALNTSASGNTIGGTTAAARNVISGNSTDGILVSSVGTTANLIEGNYIGLTVLGNASLANVNGIEVQNSTRNMIGGTASGAGNIISGNSGDGIFINGGSSTIIQGNTIGGTPGLGNGVGLYDPSTPVSLGGTVGNESNFYGYNKGPGVLLGPLAAMGSSALGERFAGNSAVGILIGTTSTSPSSPAPFTSSSPLFTPVITASSLIAGLLKVSGYGLPGTILGFYASASTDVSGNGQGVEFLGSDVQGSVEDNGTLFGTGSLAGTDQFSFTFDVPSTITPGMSVTAISAGTTYAPVVSQFAADSVTGAGSIGPTVTSGGTETVLVGQTFSYQGFFGDNASETLSGTVSYDDNTGNQPLSIKATDLTPPSYDEYTPLATGTYNLSHIFTVPGTYDVTFSVLDGDSYTASGEVTVTVLAAPPTIDPGQVTLAPTNDLSDTASPTIVNVDDSVTISGTFTDPNAGTTSSGEKDAVTVFWGDGSAPTPATVNQINHTFSASHIYTTPSSVESGKGLYAVTATLSDTEGFATTVGGGKLYAEVNDVPPTNLSLGFKSVSVAPGGTVSLSGQFQAPEDPNDLYEVVVNWGDGTAPTTVSPLGGATSFAGLKHTYQSQPAYRAGTPYTITVSVNDTYEPLNLATATAAVTVAAPTASSLAISLASPIITEGGMASLSGTLNAALPDDAHVVVINWGDGSSTLVPLSNGSAGFSGVTHPYPLNSLKQTGGVYTITATATDNDDATLAPATATATIKVGDIAPTVSNLVVTTDRNLSATTSLSTIVEGSTVYLTGSYTNPGGVLDGDTILINWGDGTTDEAILQPKTLTFLDKHSYALLPTGTVSAVKTIIATATDDEGDPGTASIRLTVSHPAPAVSIQSGGFNAAGQQMLNAPISGGDTAALNYQWTVNSVVVSTTSSYSVSPSLEVVNGNSTSNVVTVTVTEKNNPTETSSYTAQLDLLDIVGQTFVVPTPSQGVNAILVTDLAGNSILEGVALASIPTTPTSLPVIAHGVTPSKTSLIFDTPATGDTYVGNVGNDVFNEHTDGTVAYGMGGNNIFNFQALCTLTAVADSGQNTLDFASNPYAVTYNMQETEGQTQYVMPGSTAHAVIVNDLGNAGTFSTLDCSNYGDTVTAANGSTIVGGGGMDTVMLSSVSGVTVDAGTGGNTLENTAGSTLGNVTYIGDSAAATGFGGAVNFANEAGGTINGTLAFEGDSGATTFINSGVTSASASISFDGDNTAITFNNLGTQAGTINFDGDSGATTLASSQGSVGAISFDGDGAAATFINALGAVQSGSINFDGDSGAATLATAGPGTPVAFDGDNAAATFTNLGTQAGTINFDGDGGVSTFNNYVGATQSGAVAFDGDSGAATFNNSVGATQAGVITFDGDSGAATFANNGVVVSSGTVSISFDGDSGASTFANNGMAGPSSNISFDGDGGSSTFINYVSSTASGTISFDGDSGTATFNNIGATSSTALINFDGDSGAVTFNNLGAVAGGTAVNFDGDSGAATFNNLAGAVQSGAVAFDGDSAAGTFTSVEPGTTTVSFDGDGASATFNNYAGATQVGTVAFDGDSAAGTFTGAPSGSGVVSFDGDGAVATFNNYAGSTQAGIVSFDGDGAASTFNNLSGAMPTGMITFDGDGGTATFNNYVGATAAGTISFDGDNITATFNNAGVIAPSTPINFDGDNGSQTFNNQSATIQTVAINFDGDNGSQTFNNAVSATQAGIVSFDGDNTSSTLNNSGTIAPSTPINFDGDNGSQTFNNAVGAMQSGVVAFDGDHSFDLYINGSTNNPSPTAANLIFEGSDNADVFWNQIRTDSLAFDPGTQATSATLVNTGSIASYSITTVGTTVSSIALDNGAIVNGVLETGTITGPITFTGGLVLGSLVNDGTITGSVTFIGQARSGGSSTLLNLGSIDGGIVFQGDAGTDALTNDGSVAGSIVENAGLGPITLINDGTEATELDVNGDAAALSLIPTVATNRLLNQQAGLAAIRFIGGGGGNLLDNEAAGVGVVTLTSSGSDNVLSNSGINFGTITLIGDGSDSTLFNSGYNDGTSKIVSSIALNESGGTDALINSGSGLNSIALTGSDQGSGLANDGTNLGSLTFEAGSQVGIFLNSGAIGSLALQSPSTGSDSYVNSGLVGSLSFNAGSGTDYFENDGTISELNYSGEGADTFVNLGLISGTPGIGPGESSIQGTGSSLDLANEAGGTISGVLIAAGSSLDLLNYGAISGGTIIEAGGSYGRLIDYSGSSLTNVSYFASSGGDVVQSNGSINGLNFYGGTGNATTLDLFGPSNKNISFYGGIGGDTLGIGASAGNVSNLTLIGNEGTDTIDSLANNIRNVSLVAGSGAANFYNEGNEGSGLSLIGGGGTDVFYNGGPGSTGGNNTQSVTVTGGSGNTALDSTGTGFGTLTFTGGSGVNYLENDGAGTASSSIVFVGGAGDNTLDNTGNSLGSIFFTDGPGDNSNDTLSNTGNNIGSIIATVNSGELALVNSGDDLTEILATAVGGSSSVSNTGSVRTISLDGGSGNASLIDTPDSTASSLTNSTIKFTDEGGTSTFIDSAPAQQTTFDAGPVGAQVVIQTGATGPISLTGNTGGDTYTFEGAPQATVSIIQPASTSGNSVSNELDFSTFTAGSINLDLQKTGNQNLEGLLLNLTNAVGINEVVGSPETNTIAGNTQVDVLDTEALSESPATTATPNIIAPTQWVYLDFDTYANPIDGQAPQVYTTAERADVLSRIEADYASFPFVRFTENPADMAKVPAADSITLYFNKTPTETGQPGGQSSEIDFGSFDAGRYAEIQVNGLIGGPGNPSAFSNGQDNFAVLSAKIAAHELAHLFGVRHSDAFGPIGYGVHTPPGDADFSPDMNGPDAAYETFDHLISSPATEGTTRLNDIQPLYFGPREAIKLAFDEQGTVQPAATASHTSLGTAMAFPLVKLVVPNDITTISGVEQGMNFQVLAGAVSDTIGLQNGLAAPDWYSFSGQKGDDFTFETESQILPSLADGGSVDTVLGVYDSTGKLLGYYGGTAENNNQFEGTDSLLDDVILPYSGTFYVKVSSYVAPAGNPMYDPSNPDSPLNVNNLTSVDNPAGPDYNAAEAAAFLASGNGTAVGSYDLFIYRYNQSNAVITSGNTLISKTPGATLTGTSGDDTLIGTSAGTYIQGNQTISLSSTVPTSPIDFYTTNLGTLDITDSASMAGSTVTINYGDGTVTTQSASATLPLVHQYASLGSETITVSFQLAGGGIDTLDIPVSIAGLNAPTVTTPTITSGTLTTSSPVTFSSSITNFYPGDTYQAAWTFMNTASQSSFTIDETVTSAGLSLSELFTTASTYTVSVQVTNLTNLLVSTVVNGSSSFTITSKVATSISVSDLTQATSVAYTGSPFVPSSLLSITVNGATNPVAANLLSYSYYQVLSTGNSSLMQGLPTDAGNYLLVVTYAGDATHLGSSNSQTPFAFSITKVNPTLTLSPTSPVYTGVAYNGAAAVLTGVGGVSITGAVVTYTYTNAMTGTSSGNTAPTDVGSYTVAVCYGGSTDYNAVSLSPQAFKITQATLNVKVNNTSKLFGTDDSSQLTGSVSGILDNDPIVISYSSAGSTASAAASSTPYAIIATDSAPSNPIKLSDYLLNVVQGSLTVNPDRTSLSLTSSASGGAVYGALVTFSATVNNLDSTQVPAGSVTITAGGTTIGTATEGTTSSGQAIWTFTTSALAPGSYTIAATFTPTSNFQTSTSSLSQSVTAASTATTLTATAQVYGQATTLTATVTASTPSTATPAGTITFVDTTTSTTLGTVTLSASGVATLSAGSTFAAGTHLITASYTPTASFKSSSATLSQTVTAASTTTTLTATGLNFGQTTTLTATVKALSPSTATPTGPVTFTNTTTGSVLGTVTLSASGVATLSSAMLAMGTNTVTAAFAASSGFQASSASTQVSELASIYILNTSASGALNLSGSASVKVPGLVEVDSGSSSAVELSGATKVTATGIGIVGGSQVSGSSSFSVTPTKIAAFTDPLAGLPVPSASALGLKSYAAVNIGGVTTETIGPGIYPSINVSGSAKLTMTTGVYVIAGGGLIVSGGSSLTGSGVMIYNAGSNYNGGSGSSFGSVTLSSGTFSLTPMTGGTYAGVAIFQSRDNTQPVVISGAVLANLGGGAVYAPAAVMNISGSGQVGTSGTSVSPLIVNELVVSGAAGAFELAQGSISAYTASTSNWITDPELTVTAEDDTGAGLNPTEVADLGIAMDYLNQSLAPFGVDLRWAPAGTPADVTVHFATTTPQGGASDGVLGFTTPENDVYLVTGWNYYTGSDPNRIGPDQYDFITLATHELAHTVGLGESQDPTSVMYESLAAGSVRRTFSVDNLSRIDTDPDRFLKVPGSHPTTSTPPTSPADLASASLLTFDAALSALDPMPDAVSSISATRQDQLDAALALVAREEDLIPLEVAQDVAETILDGFAPGPLRKIAGLGPRS